jgi:hypothetical protein
MYKITDIKVGCTHEYDPEQEHRFDYGVLYVHRNNPNEPVCILQLNNKRRFTRAMKLLRAFAKSHPFERN